MAFAVLLVLLLRGIMDGTVNKSTAYVDHVGADVFVARAGVNNMALAASTMPESSIEAVGSQPGVAGAAGIVRLTVIAQAAGEGKPVVLIGYNPGEPLGGPWKLSEGRGVEGPGDVVLDDALAGVLSVRVGEAVDIGGESLTVVGLSAETTGIVGKLAFVRRDTAQSLIEAPGLVSFVPVKADPGTEPEALARAIRSRLPGVETMTRAELSRNDRKLLAELFVQPINVTSTVGFLVGLAIVGLTMYTTTAERLHDFGVLKAIGASNGYLLRTVISQALMLGLLGFGVGLLGVWAAGPPIVRAVPDIGVEVGLWPALRAFAAVMGMSLAGAIVPVVRIMNVDPLIVFRQ
jgi:putative ABC transport system permease protein